MSDPAEAAAPRPLSESDPNGGGPEGLAGSMGVSSERTGRVRGAPGEHANATEDSSPRPAPEDAPPEQSAHPATGPEVHPANDLPPHEADPRGSPGHLPS
jgi:hypothetical protein